MTKATNEPPGCMCLAPGLGITSRPFFTTKHFSGPLISARPMPIIHLPTTEHTLIHIP